MDLTPEDLSPSFINPQYATPEQLKTLREYSQQLMTGKGQQPVHRWTQGLSNIVNALVGGYEGNRADKIQSEAAARNSSDQAAIISALQNGGKLDPATLGRLTASPLVSPEQRALAIKLMNPEAVTSVYGQPAYQSPSAGVQAAPIKGNYTPGYRMEQGAGEVHQAVPAPAPGYTPTAPRPLPDQSNPNGGMTGGLGYRFADDGSGNPPTVGPNNVPNRPMSLDELAAKGREFAAQKAFTQGGADSITGTQKEDIAAAMNAPTIKRIAGTMLDDLKTHGDKMTFGPTAEWSNTIKRAAANYAPGLMKDQLESLASADSFDKMSAQLTSMLAKGGGTDAQLFNNMKSVPGAHNSKEGAEALLKMVNQVADQQAALRNYVASAKTPQEYEALRSQFFKENPVINPITGHPIALDIQADKNGAEETKTINGQQYIKRNGQWYHG